MNARDIVVRPVENEHDLIQIKEQKYHRSNDVFNDLAVVTIERRHIPGLIAALTEELCNPTSSNKGPRR